LVVENGLAQLIVATDGNPMQHANADEALREWVAEAKAKVEGRGATVVEEREQRIAGERGRVIVVDAVKGEIRTRTLTVCFIRGTMRYAVTFGILEAQFEALMPAVRRVLESIQFEESKDK
jgi:hypothetical protein